MLKFTDKFTIMCGDKNLFIISCCAIIIISTIITITIVFKDKEKEKENYTTNDFCEAIMLFFFVNFVLIFIVISAPLTGVIRTVPYGYETIEINSVKTAKATEEAPQNIDCSLAELSCEKLENGNLKVTTTKWLSKDSNGNLGEYIYSTNVLDESAIGVAQECSTTKTGKTCIIDGTSVEVQWFKKG